MPGRAGWAKPRPRRSPGRGRPPGTGKGRGWFLAAWPAGGKGALAVQGVEQEMAQDPDPQGDAPLVRAEVGTVEGRRRLLGRALDAQEEEEAGDLPGQVGEGPG